MVEKSGALRSDTFPNSLFRAAVGDDGGTRAELCGATPFRILDLGWRLGTMVAQSEAVAERPDLNFGVVGRG